jgi:hypothetical protein
MSFNKTTCPVTRNEFLAEAKGMDVVLGDQKVLASAKTFSTASFGWGFSDKITVMVNGKAVKCQVSLNVTVIGSKDLPPDLESKEAA